MILHVNYEELSALRSGAAALLGREDRGRGGLLAPAATRAGVEELLTRLDGDLGFSTLAELRAIRHAVNAVVSSLRAEMEVTVLARHPADEAAVDAYFDFAHGLSVEQRLREMEREMEALIELVTGRPPTSESARSFHFPS